MGLENLFIEGTEDTPRIDFKANGKLFIGGVSKMGDASEFYEPFLDWIEEYCENPAKKTIMNMKFSDFNTSTSKLILDILMPFEVLHESGKDVVVNWYYESENEDMIEAGEEFSESVNVPFYFFKVGNSYGRGIYCHHIG